MANLRVQRRRGARSDCGASLVEFALLLPVFVMLLFGGITAGLALNEKQQMTHATREGARYAAAIPPDQEFDVDGDGTAGEPGETWAAVVRTLIVERSTGTLEENDVCVSLVSGSGPSMAVVAPANQYSTAAGNAACIPGQTYAVTATDDGLRVQVTSTKDATIDLVLFGAYDVTMDGAATARSEGSL